MSDNVQIKLLRRGLEGPRDAVVSVSERRAKQLIQHNPPLAVPFTDGKKMDKKVSNKMEVPVENKAPLDDSQAGGQAKAGKAQPWLSSPEGQAPETSTSKAPGKK